MSQFAPMKGWSAQQISACVEAILAEATLAEKVAMLSGQGFFQNFRETGRTWGAIAYRAGGGCARLSVPNLAFSDGPRGVVTGDSTCFPVPMARGATFDADLERRIGEAMGIEARAQGANLSGAVCINLLRHPAWGRAQETYGEDSFHLGEMGAALAQGIQAHNVCATVKHFAVNSIENTRFKVDVRVDERTLREIYLLHFKRVIEAGCASVMSAYNKLNGAYCGHNAALLTTILREEWGFDGFVHSDWVKGLYDWTAVQAGLDVENPEPVHYGEALVAAVESGACDVAVIDTACRRVLKTLYRFACAADPLPAYPLSLVASPEHRALALEAALKATVLLKNDGLLPLRSEASLAVYGRLADMVNTGDNGSSRVRAPYVITPFQGLREAFGQSARLETDPARASLADVAIVVVGYTAQDEGEYIPGDINLGQGETGQTRAAIGGDRASLRLLPEDIGLIRAVAAANPKTVVVVIAGSAVLVSEWIDCAAAVLQPFYAGMEGGRALAQVLTGAVSPSGKLPFTVAADEADYPPFSATALSVDYGYWHGYALLERDGKTPAFPFGFGLSYARFAYADLTARIRGDVLEASVALTNIGDCAAEEVAQLYIGFPGEAAERPRKTLKGFQRVALAPGETKRVPFSVPLNDLRWWNPATRGWELERGEHRAFAGGSSALAETCTVAFNLEAG
jgi:beta-glucosidase